MKVGDKSGKQTCKNTVRYYENSQRQRGYQLHEVNNSK